MRRFYRRKVILMTTAIHTFKNRCGDFFFLAKKTWEDDTGAYYITELASSVLDLYQEATKKAPALLQNTQKILRCYIDITFAQELGLKIEEWMTTDGKGRYIWDKSPSHIFFKSMSTVYSALSGLYLLESLSIMKLGKLESPLNILSTTLQISMCSLEIFQCGKSVRKCRIKIPKTISRHIEWQKRSTWAESELKALTLKKLVKWNTLVGSGKLKGYDLHRAQEKKMTYEALNQEINIDKLRQFCKDRATHWKNTEAKYETKIKKTWAYIACDISYLALLIFSTASDYLGWKLSLPLAIATFLCNTIFVSYIFWEKSLGMKPHFAPLNHT